MAPTRFLRYWTFANAKQTQLRTNSALAIYGSLLVTYLLSRSWTAEISTRATFRSTGTRSSIAPGSKPSRISTASSNVDTCMIIDLS